MRIFLQYKCTPKVFMIIYKSKLTLTKILKYQNYNNNIRVLYILDILLYTIFKFYPFLLIQVRSWSVIQSLLVT